MANIINNLEDAPGVIAKMAAQMLADNTQFCKTIDKADESDYEGKNGYQAGDSITISKPARFIPTSSADVTSAIQDIVEEKTTLDLDVRKVVPVQLNSAEIFTDLGLEKWTKRVLKPAVGSISSHVESAFLEKAVDATYNQVGTPGSEAFDTDTMLFANQKITENGCSDFGDRYALLNSKATRLAVVDRKGLFQSSEEIAQQYKRGYMGEADGFTYLSNNLLPTHTNGSQGGTPLVNGATAEGASVIAIDGVTSGNTWTKGTVFTLAGVFAVNPITKGVYEDLHQFVVSADTTFTGGSASVPVEPAIYAASNGLQNVSALPADNAAVTVVGAASTGYAQNLAYHRNAFRMVSVPLMLPKDAQMAAQETVDGMTIRVWMASDILTDTMTMRLDFLGGLSAVRPEWASRITA